MPDGLPRLSARCTRRRRLAAIAALASSMSPALLVEERETLANASAPPGTIDLGTAVQVAWSGFVQDKRRMTEEGVVIEVVAAGSRPNARRIASWSAGRIVSMPCFVVQCYEYRVLRSAARLRVVSL